MVKENWSHIGIQIRYMEILQPEKNTTGYVTEPVGTQINNQ